MSSVIDRLAASVARLGELAGDRDASACAVDLTDEALLGGLRVVTDARRALDLLGAAFAAEVERRSDRTLGGAGLAKRAGHANGTSLVQSVTGQTRADVRRATEAGRDLTAVMRPPVVADARTSSEEPAVEPWFAPLTETLSEGRLSREQYNAIRRGLGEPPIERYPDLDPGFLPGAWRVAAVQLIAEAHDQPVEDLAATARLARDTLDPIGTQLRFDERYARRSFRMFVDEYGQRHARIAFDDDAAAWVETLMSAALRPRRGPRFVDPDEARRIKAEVAEDTRTNDQLQYDTLMAVLRTGAAADPAQAFGDRQPGVRIVIQQQDAAGAAGAAVGYYQETGQAVPASVVETYLCDAGWLPLMIDSDGNPLDVGREERLYTPQQRVAITCRDGGCLWCGADPSRCEVHHLVDWRLGGRTDVADGILLCTTCHLRLHNQGWRITRRGTEYWLHPPDGPPRRLRSRSLLRFAQPATRPQPD